MYLVELKQNNRITKVKQKENFRGPVRESNPGPLAPKARIMPLDQQASSKKSSENLTTITFIIETGLQVSFIRWMVHFSNRF